MTFLLGQVTVNPTNGAQMAKPGGFQPFPTRYKRFWPYTWQ